VSGDQNESAWTRADLFVLTNGQLDELVAPETGALTTEADRGVLVPRPSPAHDALVADRRLVSGGAPLLVALHGRMLSRGANPRQTAGLAHFGDISERSDDQRELVVGRRAD
jgi:hypothetical protein